jgi:hypothetical protein
LGQTKKKNKAKGNAAAGNQRTGSTFQNTSSKSLLNILKAAKHNQNGAKK